VDAGRKRGPAPLRRARAGQPASWRAVRPWTKKP